MGKEISTFGDIEFEKKLFYHHHFGGDVDTEKVLVSSKISFGEKTVNTLLVTCIMITNLSHYIQCFLKQALM